MGNVEGTWRAGSGGRGFEREGATEAQRKRNRFLLLLLLVAAAAVSLQNPLLGLPERTHIAEENSDELWQARSRFEQFIVVVGELLLHPCCFTSLGEAN